MTRHILDEQNLLVLSQLAWSRCLLAFDFDGTLAPIVAERDAAKMRGRTRQLLSSLCARYPCAVISGRGLADVAARLDGLAVGHIIGNHGIEPSPERRRFARLVATLKPTFERLTERDAGIDIEDKTYSLAIHYRRSRKKQAARAAIASIVERLGGQVRVVPGKLVVNVLPAGAPHKGIALTELRARVNADTALYVGDDVTDEDVFALDQPGRLLSIRVGQKRGSAAAYHLRDQREIDSLLALLVRLRPSAHQR